MGGAITSDPRREYMDALGFSQAEVRRLRTQLGCVKALATLWEEEAVKAKDVAGRIRNFDMDGSRTLEEYEAVHRSHAAALREMLSGD